MPDETPNCTPEPKRVHLTPRKSPDDYWEGYKAGLKAAREGIDKTIAHFDDMLISRKMDNSAN